MKLDPDHIHMEPDRMTGPREAGVLLGQARAREARKGSCRDENTLALERIAAALEGIEVSAAVIADLYELELSCLGAPEGDEAQDMDEARAS